MPQATTHDIRVSVETAYQPTQSENQGLHLFAYRITIENFSEERIRLLRRHWYIHDLLHDRSEVEGEGVIGEQPLIEPGNFHQYVSGCQLTSGIGRMYGTYQMQRLDDGRLFEVDIPEFALIAPIYHN